MKPGACSRAFAFNSGKAALRTPCADDTPPTSRAKPHRSRTLSAKSIWGRGEPPNASHAKPITPSPFAPTPCPRGHRKAGPSLRLARPARPALLLLPPPHPPSRRQPQRARRSPHRPPGLRYPRPLTTATSSNATLSEIVVTHRRPQIDLRRAGLLLLALQVAAKSLPRARPESRPITTPPHNPPPPWENLFMR